MKKLFLILITLSLNGLVLAQWNINSAVNTPVCTAPYYQKSVSMVTDTKGGAIICWSDNRISTVNADVYVQRMNANGYAKWTMNGIGICLNDSNQGGISMIEDGTGGAFIAWNDFRSGDRDIYTQHVDSNGTVLWIANGIAVAVYPYHQEYPKLVSDGNGGAIIVWEDMRNGVNFDIYAQRINSAGVAMWAMGGVAMCSAIHNQKNPRIETDGAGGAIIAWEDKRNGVDYDIYAQRISALGVWQWTANGVAVCNSVGMQKNQKLRSDGQGGVIIVWEDSVNTTNSWDIKSQRVNAGVDISV